MYMVSYERALQISEDCFKKNDWNGVGEVLEGEEFWIFRPNIKELTYGAFSVIVFKDDIEKARLLWPPDEIEMIDKIKNTKVIFSS